MADQIGKLDRRITIQRATTITDDFNEPVESWPDFTHVWASKTDVRDGEKWAAQEVGATITTRFVIRWSSKAGEITPKDRILSDARTYDIHGIKEIGRRRYLEITAAARAE